MTSYQCVTNIEALRTYLGDSSVVSFDYETAPLDDFRTEEKAALDPHKSQVVGCSFTVKPNTGIYVPLGHRGYDNMDNDDFWRFMGEFLTSDCVKIAHNFSFESKMSYHKNIVIQPPVYDTMAAAQLVQDGESAFRKLSDCGLKQLAAEWCGASPKSYREVVGDRHFDELNPQDETTLRYGCADSDYALQLYHLCNDWFEKFLPEHRRIAKEIESPTAVYLGIMEHNGVPINASSMDEKEAILSRKITSIKGEIENMTHVNIGETGNNKAFQNYVFETLKIPVFLRTEKGAPSLNDEALVLMKQWCADHLPDHVALFDRLQELRKLKKLHATYIAGYRKCIHPVTGCIHGEFLSQSTDTGRMSCHNPNLQNMPRKSNDPIGIRELIAAKDGEVILSLDFSQIELRVGAFYCRDETMLETYRTGGDIHAATTSVIFGISKDEALDKSHPDYKERRTIAKNVNFGTFYGLYPKGLMKTLNLKAGLHTTLEECADILQSLKDGYPGLDQWQKQTIEAARKRGYTASFLGRRRYLNDIRSTDWKRKSFHERCALNTPIQGTAADILKLSLVRILRGLSARPWLKPILQIHDELVFTVPKEHLDKTIAFVKSCMEAKPFPQFDLPLVAEAQWGNTFAG